MTIRRRTATPTFQRPLTTAELTGILKLPRYPVGGAILCEICGERGYRGLRKTDTGYCCNDTTKCQQVKREKMLLFKQAKTGGRNVKSN